MSRNLRRSLITGSMVALGVAAIVFFRGYIVGLEQMMVDMVINTMTGPLQIERAGASSAKGTSPLELDLPTDGEFLERVRAAPGVIDVSPRLKFGAFLMHGEQSTMVGVMAVDPAREKQVCPRGPGAGHSESSESGGAVSGLDGTPLSGFDDDTIIVGTTLAKGLGLKMGQTITLLTQTRAGSTDAIDGVVRGLYNSGDPETNKRLVLMSLGRAQQLVHMSGRATSLAVGFQNQPVSKEQVAAVRSALRGSQPPVDVRTWEELAPYYRDVITLQDNVMMIVMGIIFVLVLAGIVNTMMMSVFERQREIGTLMAIGFSRRTIIALFMAEALALGFFSGVCGLLLGLAVVGITHQVGIPFTVPAVGTIVNHPIFDLRYTAAAAAMAIVAALGAGLYPAYRASRLKPIEALHAI